MNRIVSFRGALAFCNKSVLVFNMDLPACLKDKCDCSNQVTVLLFKKQNQLDFYFLMTKCKYYTI